MNYFFNRISRFDVNFFFQNSCLFTLSLSLFFERGTHDSRQEWTSWWERGIDAVHCEAYCDLLYVSKLPILTIDSYCHMPSILLHCFNLSIHLHVWNRKLCCRQQQWRLMVVIKVVNDDDILFISSSIMYLLVNIIHFGEYASLV